MNKIINYIKKIVISEAFRYIVVGGFTTLVNLIVFTLMNKLLLIDVTISNITSVIVSIIFACYK